MAETKAKANSVITTELVGKTIVFKVKDAGELVLELGKLHSEVAAKALVHGMIPRVTDAAAIARDTATGKSASPMKKLEAMRALVEHYNSGASEWRLARAEGSGLGRSYLLNAMCELRGDKTREELSNWLKERSGKERTALENSPRIKPLIDRMKAEGLEGIDTEEMLAGI